MTRTAAAETIIHPIPPLFSEDSTILILGSFPSVKSREAAFFTAIRRIGSGEFWQKSLKIRSP